MARVKVCGINSPAALAAASGADWVGFNFFPASPRYVTPMQAALLTSEATRVGLFVDPTDDVIAATLAVVTLDVLQIYAIPERASIIRRRFGLPVWRSVGVASRSDLPVDDEAIDGFVIESRALSDVALPGGNALSFDWALLKDWRAPVPWLLAGGLNPANVAEAIVISGATAVDVASGVERERGVKDSELVLAFFAAARDGSSGRAAAPVI